MPTLKPSHRADTKMTTAATGLVKGILLLETIKPINYATTKIKEGRAKRIVGYRKQVLSL